MVMVPRSQCKGKKEYVINSEERLTAQQETENI